MEIGELCFFYLIWWLAPSYRMTLERSPPGRCTLARPRLERSPPGRRMLAWPRTDACTPGHSSSGLAGRRGGHGGVPATTAMQSC